MYNGNMQVKKGDLLAFHKVVPPLLWLINTTGCCRRVIWAYFADDFAFAKLPGESCYDNYYYDQVVVDDNRIFGKVPLWELHDLTAKHSMQYQYTKDWIQTQEIKAGEKKSRTQLLREKDKMATQKENTSGGV